MRVGQSVRALCEDGVERAAVLTREPDTFFSQPARVKAKGKTIKGFVTCDHREGKPVTFFHAQGKNGVLLTGDPVAYAVVYRFLSHSIHHPYADVFRGYSFWAEDVKAKAQKVTQEIQDSLGGDYARETLWEGWVADAPLKYQNLIARHTSSIPYYNVVVAPPHRR